jgi:hypothetical protein
MRDGLPPVMPPRISRQVSPLTIAGLHPESNPIEARRVRRSADVDNVGITAYTQQIRQRIPICSGYVVNVFNNIGHVAAHSKIDSYVVAGDQQRRNLRNSDGCYFQEWVLRRIYEVVGMKCESDRTVCRRRDKKADQAPVSRIGCEIRWHPSEHLTTPSVPPFIKLPSD